MNRDIHSLQTTCTDQQTQILNAIQNKTIDAKITVKLPNVEIYIGDGWYTITVPGVYVLVYIDKSDSTYNYVIQIIKTPGVTIDCSGIVIQKTDKLGTPAPDNVVPQSVINKAIATFPTATACGTGVLDGCTAGIPNTYLIAGGIVAAYFLFLKEK